MDNRTKILHWVAQIDQIAREIEAFANDFGLAASHRIMVERSNLVWAGRGISTLATDKEIKGGE